MRNKLSKKELIEENERLKDQSNEHDIAYCQMETNVMGAHNELRDLKEIMRFWQSRCFGLNNMTSIEIVKFLEKELSEQNIHEEYPVWAFKHPKKFNL